MADFLLAIATPRYICEAIDFNATHNPNHPFYSYADDNAAGGVAFITHTQFADASHHAAYLIRPDLTSPQGEVVAIISNSDAATYHPIVAGTMLAGLVPFPISPRNSPAAILNLLQKANCHRILTTKHTLQPLLEALIAHISTSVPSFAVQIDESPALFQLYPFLDPDSQGLQKEEVRYPWQKYRTDINSPCVYFHSSGSTGLPKAIPLSHKVVDFWCNLPIIRKFKEIKGPTVMACMSLPVFHIAGIIAQVLIPVFSGATSAIFPPSVFQAGHLPMLPSPDNVLEHTVRTQCNEMAIIPAFLQVWAQDSIAIEQLKRLDEIIYFGGNLATEAGETLIEGGVILQSLYGSTEIGPITSLDRRPQYDKDWEYLTFDHRAKIRFEHQRNRTYEVQVLKNDTLEPAVINMPDDEGYSTSDLFEEHPTRKGLYRMVGRLDDVIVHSSGEKTVPAPIERVIMSDPRVAAVVLFGRGQNFVGVLVELKPVYQVDPVDYSAVNNMKVELWQAIEKANHIAPAFSRIYKDMIIFAPPNKPIPRTGKGTIMRSATLEFFEDEIMNLYDNIANGTLRVNTPNSWDKLAFTSWIAQQLEDLYPETKADTMADLFEQGMDSLGVAFIRQRIVSAFGQVNEARFTSAAQKITDSQIYAHPTIDSLVCYLLSLLCDEDGKINLENPRKEIQDMVTKFSTDLPAPPKAYTYLQDSIVVLLTGSTGNLGAHILSELLQDQRVAKVYVLNRPSSIPSTRRQENMFDSHGLHRGLLNLGKLVYLEGDAARDYVGLDPALYEELRTSVNVIVHNAWRLDFNLGLSSFQSNIRGTRNLINLALTGSWTRSRGPFPEEPLNDPGVAVGPGYGASKYVSERILVESGLQFCSLRIGQLSGGYPNGAWATTDWFPIMVKSSIHLGVLPSSPGVISWLPIDIAAHTVKDIIFLKGEAPTTVNMVHPCPILWNDVVKFINEALVNQCVIKEQLREIPFGEWVHQLEKHAATPTDEILKAMPAIKLEKFFKSIARAEYANPIKDEIGIITRFSTAKGLATSSAFSHSKTIQKDDAERWIKYWKSVGYFVT